jgi:D-alanyl-D-alanine carboxypeptidase
VIGQVLRAARQPLLVASVALTMVATSLVMSAAPASAKPPVKPALTEAQRPARTKPPVEPVVAEAQTLTPRQLSVQVKAAEALRADLMMSSAQMAAANARLERFSAQANALVADLSAARPAEVDAEISAAAQRRRLSDLLVEVQAAQDALGRLASDSYIRRGGPMGEIAALFDALTIPSPDQNTDSSATVRYLMDARARIFDRLQSLQSEQVTTLAQAAVASTNAAAAARTAAVAKSTLDGVIAEQLAALGGFRAAQAGQVAQVAGLRGVLLRSTDPAARAADRALVEALRSMDFLHVSDGSSRCGTDTVNYPNGLLPASALCPLYTAPGQSLRREATMAFDAMSSAYQRQTGSELCVTDSYRSYAEQVAVKAVRKGFAATPGSSQHGLGLALDLCGGVQNFSAPAHLWMQRNAPLYGWFHPAWAEPSGALPEPWHWEFAS